MSKPFYVSLPNRGLVRIAGDDRVAFMQGLVSNDVAKAMPDRIVYACLLTPQGKFLHDFFIHSSADALLLECEGGERAQDLHDRLSKFKLRARVQLSVETVQPVFAAFGLGGMPDPRHVELGSRVFQKPDGTEQPFEIYDRLRLPLGVPDGSRDMEIERSTLLECGIDKLNGIDWNKGCYIGQELTARTHYRGLVKKHLYPVRIRGDAPAPFGDLPHGGSMRSRCGDLGLALLRDDKLDEDYGMLAVMK